MDMLLVIEQRNRLLLFPIGFIFFFAVCAAQTNHPKSLALKDLTPERSPFRLQQDRSDEDLWDAFQLITKANSGNAVAEHELGLQYLLGKGFPADTLKAAYWIKKAAEHHSIAAQYNYGLLLNNGWGVSWNPFEAYRHFQVAATHGLVEAEYVYGLLQTDDLAVPRNYPEAYRWMKMAADSGFTPAKEVLKEFVKRGIMARIESHNDEKGRNAQPSHSANPPHARPGMQPVYLDFTSSDSVGEPDNISLLKEALQEQNAYLKTDSLGAEPDIPEHWSGPKTIEALREAGESGSPEALTMLARIYEQGLGVKKDLLEASVYYVRAVRFDSPWAPMFLWKMIQTANYFPELKRQVDAGNPDAEFVWAGLIENGFDRQLTDAQALSFLEDAARQGFPQAIVQMGVCYYSGHWVTQNREKAIELFRLAESLGNKEARMRLLTIELRNDRQAAAPRGAVDTLQQYAAHGSILAEAMLGYCYQQGKGVMKNNAEAVRFYRRAAQRGSQVAYDALRKMYDDVRPRESEFQLQE